jgi:hypothetical protein
MFSLFYSALQSTKMVKKQTKASRLQAANKKKNVQDALHDTEATDDDVDSPDLHDKVPYPTKEVTGTQEMAPDPQDKNLTLEKETKTKDDDNDLPTVSDRDLATNVGTSTDVGTGLVIGEHSPFDTHNTTTDERVDNTSVSNVDDVVNPHINDGAESTISDEGTDNEQVLDDAIPWKKPSRPMVTEPQVHKQSKHKLSPLFYVHFVLSQSSAGGRLRRE